MAAASEASAERLDQLLGRTLDAAEVAEARAIITNSGALTATERDIEASAAEALSALDGVAEPARTGLAALVAVATRRDA